MLDSKSERGVLQKERDELLRSAIDALKAARDLKGRFPMLQVKVYDAETKLSENIGLVAA